MNILQEIFSKAGFEINTDANRPKGRKLLFVANTDGSPRWVWPASLTQPLFLNFYNVSGPKAKAFAAFTRFVFFLGIQNRIFKSVQSDVRAESVSFQPFDFNQNNWTLFTGTPGPNRKAVVLVETQDEPTFLKIPLGKKAKDLLENETFSLQFLQPFSFESFIFPTIKSKGEAHLSLSALKQGNRAGCLTTEHNHFLNELSLINKDSGPLSSLSFWHTVKIQMTRLAHLKDTRIPNGLVRKLEGLKASFSQDAIVETSFSHGDFTSWNLYHGKDKLAVYDWELASPQRPVGFDAIHFIVQQGILLERKSWKEIRKEIDSQSVHWSFLGSAETRSLALEKYLSLYFLLNTSYYLLVYSEQEIWHTQVNWLIETWSLALSDLLGKETANREILAMDTFDFLQKETYATLKFKQELPENLPVGSDFDICLERKVAKKLSSFLNQHPLVQSVSVQSKSFMNSLAATAADGSVLHIDALWQLKRKHLEMMDIRLVLANALPNEAGIFKASAWYETLFVSLFYGLNGKDLPEGFAFPDSKTDDQRLLPNHPVEGADLRKQIAVQPANQGLSGLRNRFFYLLDTARGWFANDGITVTFSGVDGAGKSTVIEQIKQRVEKQFRKRVVVIRHRPSVLPILSAWTKGKAQAEKEAAERLPRQGSNARFLPSLLRFSYYYTDYLLGQFFVWFRYLSRGYVVLYDRYYFDFINDSKRSNITLSPSFTTQGYRFLMKPELNLFLYADPQTILSRKQELSAETITDLTAKYTSLFARLNRSASNSEYLAIQNEDLELTLQTVMNKIKQKSA